MKKYNFPIEATLEDNAQKYKGLYLLPQTNIKKGKNEQKYVRFCLFI
ncbi:hypothetical protein ACQVPP_24845 [Bacillus luti]